MDVYTHFWNVCHIYAFRSVVYIPFRRGLLRVVCSDDSGMRRPQRLRTGNAGVHALSNALKTFLSYPCLSATDAKSLRQTKTTDEDDRQTAGNSILMTFSLNKIIRIRIKSVDIFVNFAILMLITDGGRCIHGSVPPPLKSL